MLLQFGIDKAEDNNLSLSVQFAMPEGKIGDEENQNQEDQTGGGSAQSKASDITTISCSSIYNGIDLINSYTSKQVNLYNTKLVVISEEMAKERNLAIYLYINIKR